MVTAPVLVPMEWGEATEQTWTRDQTRRELHECFDLWLDGVEEAMEEESASLDAMTRAVFARRQELTSEVTEALVRRRHAQASRRKSAPCPQCGRSVRSRGLVSRTVETLVGEVTLERHL